MPLVQSSARDAVGRNISTLRREGRPENQAVAIALDIQRRNRAQGGIAGAPASGGVAGHAVGYLRGGTPGRADKIKTTAPANAYVIPADVVSALGQGNSDAGARKIDEMIKAKRASRAKGGPVPTHGTPVLLSHGEYVVAPVDVIRFGNGDLRAGLRWFDAWVVDQRKNLIKKLRNLPGPVKTQ